MSQPSPIRASQPPNFQIPLHPGQLEVARDPSRFKVVCCGRQWGKTHLGAALALESALAGGQVWWVGPSFPVGELGMGVVNRLARQVAEILAPMGAQVRFEGRPVWRVTFPSGGTIQMRSADNPDSLRGATLDLVIFDEAATAKTEAWPTLRPTLSVRRGKAVFISTPKGQNWFHDLYEDADGLEDWGRWRVPSVNNPWIPPSDVEKARQEMSSLVFSQEYEAEFISYGSGMFRAEWMRRYRERMAGEERIYMLGEEPVRDSDIWRFHTVDLAWGQGERADFTVISTWGVTPKRHMLLLDCVRGHFEGPEIVPKLSLAYERHGGYMAVEKATRQMGIVVEAERMGLPIRHVVPDKDKVARALPATARMEQGAIWFPPASTPWMADLEEELLAFPASRHDDFVDTLSYAVLELADRSAYTDHGLRTV